MLRALLDRPAAQKATLLRARALAAAANLLEKADGYLLAGEYCDEALAIARAAGDDYLVADLLQIRVWPMLRQGQPDAALPLIEQGLCLACRRQDPRLTGLLLCGRSFALNIGGDSAGAARDAAESLRLFRQAGDQLLVGATLGNLGNYELAAGDLDAARSHLAESLDIARALNARDGIAHWTFNLGLTEYLSGSLSAAGALFAETLDLGRRMGMKAIMAYALLGWAMVGNGAAGAGWSARLHGAADQALADLGHAMEPLEERLAGLDRQRLRAVMGAGAFDAEYATGRTRDPGQVADEVLYEVRARREAQRAGALISGPGAAAPEGVPTVLTPRELDVLKLVAQGMSNHDIAQRLVLSEHTVHRHLANILRKLNLSSRAAAAAWGVRTGLV